MKAITLIQPWASLVALGEKRIETRSWSTKYRGPLAIHASKKIARVFPWFEEPFKSVMHKHGILSITPGTLLGVPSTNYQFHDELLPLGCVIATCRLTEVFKIHKNLVNLEHVLYDESFFIPPDEPELSFGDYIPGRFAWILEDVVQLPEPIPAKGSLGLWEWSTP